MAEAGQRLPRLIVFSDRTRAEPAFWLSRCAALAERAQPGSVSFYVRDYALSVGERWALTQQLSILVKGTGHWFGIADRADVARALGCSAFHLPEAGFCARDARAFLGPQVFLSRGSHDPAGPLEPELDAALLSPIFQPRKGRAPLGLAGLVQASDRAPPRFALGGVAAHQAASCIAAGAAGVAVIGAALEPDPQPLLHALGILRC